MSFEFFVRIFVLNHNKSIQYFNYLHIMWWDRYYQLKLKMFLLTLMDI